jgi:hypothetical protein
MSNIKTFASMALIYTLITPIRHNPLHATKHNLNFNHAMGAIGATAYTLVDGMSQIRRLLTHCDAPREGRKWYTDPGCVYHGTKAVSGIALFYILFGAGDVIVGGLVRRFEV